MLLNDIKKEIKILCIENNTTQAQVADKIGTTGQYVSRVIQKEKGLVNETLLKLAEALGYDLRIEFVKQEAKDNE